MVALQQPQLLVLMGLLQAHAGADAGKDVFSYISDQCFAAKLPACMQVLAELGIDLCRQSCVPAAAIVFGGPAVLPPL